MDFACKNMRGPGGINSNKRSRRSGKKRNTSLRISSLERSSLKEKRINIDSSTFTYAYMHSASLNYIASNIRKAVLCVMFTMGGVYFNHS